MIRVYGMKTCRDCQEVYKKIAGDKRYQLIDIGEHVKFMGAFLKLREHNEAFRQCREHDKIGIPAFVLEDGTVTLDPSKAGVQVDEAPDAPSCSIDGHGC